MRFPHLLTPAFLVGALGACGHVPVTSLYSLSKVNFATTDPRSLRAAVALPEALAPRQVALRLVGRINRGPAQREEFLLKEVTDEPIPETLAESSKGGRITAYRLSESDAARLSAFRTSLFRQKAETGGTGELEMTVHPEACLVTQPAPGPVLATTYIKTSETGAYVALARNLDLRTVDPKRDLIAEAPPCRQTPPKG